MGWVVPAILVLASLMTAGVILLGHVLHSFSLAFLISFATLTGIWVAGEVLRDAD